LLDHGFVYPFKQDGPSYLIEAFHYREKFVEFWILFVNHANSNQSTDQNSIDWKWSKKRFFPAIIQNESNVSKIDKLFHDLRARLGRLINIKKVDSTASFSISDKRILQSTEESKEMLKIYTAWNLLRNTYDQYLHEKKVAADNTIFRALKRAEFNSSNRSVDSYRFRRLPGSFGSSQ
jgi:hypothetical protein